MQSSIKVPDNESSCTTLPTCGQIISDHPAMAAVSSDRRSFVHLYVSYMACWNRTYRKGNRTSLLCLIVDAMTGANSVLRTLLNQLFYTILHGLVKHRVRHAIDGSTRKWYIIMYYMRRNS
jgi:hypothetical protein